jgi:2-phosphosulfolactate phosphatase
MIDVAVTPAELRSATVAVVIDVLRATSTVTQALAAGYRQVLCADSLERAVDLRAPGRVLAGERRCLTPPGFDHGNSPVEAARRRGDELVLATTNGAPAIVAAAARAPTVLLACLLNLGAVIAALRIADAHGECDVLIVCSGTDGVAALEDFYVAGRLSAALRGPRTDAARIAEAVARGYPTALEALAASADAQVLTAEGLEADIGYCAQESVLDTVPRVLVAADGVAVVVRDGARSEAIAEEDLSLAVPSTL